MLILYLGKCRVQVNFSCFALLAFCCIFTGMGGGAACFLAVILHEMGHLAAMRLQNVSVSEVIISALGCRVICEKEIPLPDKGQAIIALAGPAVNWLCFVLLSAFGYQTCPFASVSFALGLAHSLPIEPLDGGLALRYFLREKLDEMHVDILSRTISVIFLFPLAVLGFLVLLRTQYNYSLLALSIYLMLYLVLGWDYSQP